MTPDTVVASSRRQNTVSDSQSLELEPENFPSHQVLLAWFGYPGCPRIHIRRWEQRRFLGLVSKHLMPGSKADLWIQPLITAVLFACWPIYIRTGGTQDCKSAQ